MIKTHTEVGGWYGDCTLEGDYVSLHRNSHLVVNGERLDLPPGQINLLQLVCMRFHGQLLIAGQGQAYNNWLWKDNKWIDLGSSFGTFSCAFGPSTLYFVCGPNQYRTFDLINNIASNSINRVIGSNGIRYIDFYQSSDGIVTGDKTYGPTPYNLSQWSADGDLVVGQSYIQGAIGQYGENYLLENGDTQFIRLHRDGGRNFCVAIVKMKENSTVFYWMTIEELKLFPIVHEASESKPIDKKPGPVFNNPPIIKPSVINKPKPPVERKKMSLPSLDQWIHVEFPQLLAAYIKTQGHSPDPDFEWAAFQTYRRFMEPEAWPFERMLRHELGDDSPETKPNPQ